MRKKLLITLFLLFSFIPCLRANALTLEELPALPTEYSTNNYEIVTNKNNQVYLYFYEDQYLFTINGISNSYSPHRPYTITFGGTTTASPIEGFSDTIYAYTYQLNKSTNTWDYKGNLTTPTMYSAHDFNIFSNFKNDPTTITPYLKEKVIYTNVNHFYTPDDGVTFIQVLSVSDYGVALEEKKNFLYNNDEMTNPMRYIDLYFNKEDLGKKINFSIKFEDFFDYSSCSYCEYLNIEKFEFSYLIQDENGLYKWVDISNTSTGVGFDYDGETLPKNEDGSGFEITGRIDLDYNTTTYDFEKIRASIKLANGYNFKYIYSDDSNISDGNIDEYYHYMTYDSGKRLNRIDSGITKYTILTTTQNEINASLLVEYINTSKYLYVEYFDTLVNSYISNGMIYSYDYFLIDNRDIEKFNFKIGKNNARGIYLMNYLYQKNNENLDSKYYFYIPSELSYSYTDFLDEAIYYNSTGSITDGIISNPNYETDNTKFTDNFRIIYNFLEELQQTSDTFNYMWNNFYAVMPNILKAFFQVITHLLCIWVFMKIVGYD